MVLMRNLFMEHHGNSLAGAYVHTAITDRAVSVLNHMTLTMLIRCQSKVPHRASAYACTTGIAVCAYAHGAFCDSFDFLKKETLRQKAQNL